MTVNRPRSMPKTVSALTELARLLALFAFLLVDHHVRPMPPPDGGFILQKVG